MCAGMMQRLKGHQHMYDETKSKICGGIWQAQEIDNNTPLNGKSQWKPVKDKAYSNRK
jgi:hypothetical protein